MTNSTIWDPDISDHSLPDSLYLSSKPSWWPASVPWPPIGPDVSGMTNKLPAQVCYEQGKMPNCLESVVGDVSGDVSGDGHVTMHDAALVFRYVSLGVRLSDAQKQANLEKEGDFNGDGKVDGADVMAIAKKALGL